MCKLLNLDFQALFDKITVADQKLGPKKWHVGPLTEVLLELDPFSLHANQNGLQCDYIVHIPDIC